MVSILLPQALVPAAALHPDDRGAMHLFRYNYFNPQLSNKKVYQKKMAVEKNLVSKKTSKKKSKKSIEKKSIEKKSRIFFGRKTYLVEK